MSYLSRHPILQSHQPRQSVQPLHQIHNKINRNSINQQYMTVTQNRQTKHAKSVMNDQQSYIQYLENANKKLHHQLDQVKVMYEKQINTLKDRIKTKDILLSDCQNEIGKIRKQFQVIDHAVNRQAVKMERTNSVGKHGLLRDKKNRV